jgi:2,4-dienoyl-CoA reductase-like NADH-dependent reductase (Old Yellow Enzyme family)
LSVLFTPIEVKGIRLRNRVAMPPMVTLNADERGCVTDTVIEHYARPARAGTGLVIVEATAVDERGRVWAGGLGAFSDEHVPGLARLAAAIKAEGAAAGIQLVHGGPQGDLELPGNDRVGASEVDPPRGGAKPRALAAEEILAIEERFAEAAGRCLRAGFDLVEVHGAHDFLLDSFLTTQTNKREDRYGGDITGRMRMMVETCGKVKAAVGDSWLLDCRFSVFNKAPGEFGEADLTALVSALAKAGVDVLHISTDGVMKDAFGTGKSIGRLVRGMCGRPVIAAGGLGDPPDAERAVAEGHADIAAIGSAMYGDPNWTEKARAVLGG